MPEGTSAGHPSTKGEGLSWAIGPLIALIAMAVTLFMPAVMNDGDTHWHLATGQWILDHRAVPHEDPFSFSKLGAPWQAHEWLSEVIMALAYQAAGWSGLVVLFGGVMALTFGLIALRLAKSISGLTLLSVLALSLACMAPSLLLRPHILALPLIVAFTAEILAARDEGRAPRLWFAVLMALWANLHGSYVFGMALAAPFALEALLDAKTFPERRKVVISWGAFGLLCLAATAVTPHGVKGMIFPLQLMTMSTLDGIIEWRSADFTRLGPLEVALLASIFVFLRFPVKLPVIRLLVLLLLLHMALRHTRHITVLGAVAPLILAAPLGAAMGIAGSKGGRRVLIAILAGVIVLAGVRLALPITRENSIRSPDAALAAVPEDLRQRPVLNEYGYGGYLIFNGVRPYIDGRADMYGDAFAGRYFEMAKGNSALLDETLAKSGIAWTMLPPSHPLTPLMDAKPGWTRLYADPYAVIHTRTGG